MRIAVVNYNEPNHNYRTLDHLLVPGATSVGGHDHDDGQHGDQTDDHDDAGDH